MQGGRICKKLEENLIFSVYYFEVLIYNCEYMMKPRKPAQRIAADALLAALGLITFLIENLFPPLFFPGAKMGLANIFSLAALILFGPADAFAVLTARTLLGAMFAGNASSLMYSLTGGAAAMALSALLMYLVYPKVSVMAVSVAAAVLHNIVQNLVFAAISATPLALSYLPYLALLGVLSGALVGAAEMLIFKKVPLSAFARATGGTLQDSERGRGEDQTN